MAGIDPALADEQYCYLTTKGRMSGEPREIEIWFGLAAPGAAPGGWTLYMLSEGRDRSNWVRNLVRDSRVMVRIGDSSFDGRARVVEDAEEDAAARSLLLDKYSAGYSGDLTDWGRTALPVAVDLSID